MPRARRLSSGAPEIMDMTSRQKTSLINLVRSRPEFAENVGAVIGRDLSPDGLAAMSDSDLLLAVVEYVEAGYALAPLAKARDVVLKLERHGAQLRGDNNLVDQLALSEARVEQLEQENADLQEQAAQGRRVTQGGSK
jgi:hypothetical protein